MTEPLESNKTSSLNSLYSPINNNEIKNSNKGEENTVFSPLISRDEKEEFETEKLTFCQVIKLEIVQLKWRMFIFFCVMTFGQYYINDFPGSIGTGPNSTIQSKFAEHGKHYDQEMNQVLYSVYSYPNTVLAIFGGLLIDKYLGIRKATFLFMSLIFFGSILFYIGVMYVNYPLMVASRFIYGLGGESNTVAQSAYISRYFSKGRGMALAFGICISVSRVGSSFTFMFSPLIASKYGIDIACFVGVLTCALSFISVIVIIFIDIHAEKKGIVFALDQTKTFRFKNILKFPITVWLLCGICVFSYCAIFPFSGIAKNFYQVKYNLSGEVASLYVSFYLYSSAACSPIVGALADKVGRYPLWCLGASAGFILVHLAALATPVPGYIISIFLGIPLSALASGVWPSVPYIVNHNVVGFCYGVITALQNAGLATWPVITGAILDIYTPQNAPPSNFTTVTTSTIVTTLTSLTNVTTRTSSSNATARLFLSNATTSAPSENKVHLPTMKGFIYVEIFLMLTAGVGFLLSVLLIIFDKLCEKGILMSTPAVRSQLIKERELQEAIEDEDIKKSLKSENECGRNKNETNSVL